MNPAWLPLRNIVRNTSRSWVVSFCALLVSALALSSTLVINGAGDSLRLAAERLGADVVVVPEGSEAKVEGALLMGATTRVWMPRSRLDQIATIPEVAVISPQVYLSSLKNASCCSVSDMFVVAFDPATDFTVQPWLTERLGRGLGPGEAVGGCYVFMPPGQDRIKLYGYLLSLRGNLEPTGSGLDNTLFVTMDTAQEIASGSWTQAESALEIVPDSVSAALIKLKPGSDPRLVALQIMLEVPGVTAIRAPDLFQSYRRQLGALLGSVRFVLGMTLAVSALLIGMIFSITANERRRELGVLRALGATRLLIFRTLLIEAMLLALAGGLAGTLLATLSTYLFRRLIMVTFGVPFLYPSLGSLLAEIGGGLAIALLIVTLAALWPTYRVSRQDAAAAMRE